MRQSLLVIAVFVATSVYAGTLSNVEVMSRVNSAMVLKPNHQLEIHVNDSFLPAERVFVDKSGTILSRYGSSMTVAGISPRQLALQIRGGIMQKASSAGIRLPQHVRSDPLVLVTVVGILRERIVPTCLEETDEKWTIRAGERVVVSTIAGVSELEVTCEGNIFAQRMVIPVEGLTGREATLKFRSYMNKKYGRNMDSINALIYPSEIDTMPMRAVANRQGGASITVMGRVQYSRGFDLEHRDGLTVSDLLKMAGGATRRSVCVRIVRNTPQGQKSIQVHAKAVLRDRNPEYDLFVRPNDVIIVE